MSREYLDEFFKEATAGHRVVKPAREFGEKAAIFIRDFIVKYYGRHSNELPAGEFPKAEDCVGAFYGAYHLTMKKAMESPRMVDDRSFESYVRECIQGWFKRQYEQTPEGLQRGMLRQRLSRDGRFVNRSRTSRGEGGSAILPRSMWGLVNGPATPSTVREEELKAVSYRFPITSDPIAMQDPNRQRAPRYAATGEIENMFAEVLEVAQGTLDLAVLHRIAQYRIPATRWCRFLGLGIPGGGPWRSIRGSSGGGRLSCMCGTSAALRM